VGSDQAIELEELKKWGGSCRNGVGEGKHVDGRGGEYGFRFRFKSGDEIGIDEVKGKGKERNVYVDVDEADRTVSIHREAKAKRKYNASYLHAFPDC
jgi:hypothetical protein